MQTQVVTEELQQRVVEATVEIFRMESNEAFLLHAICAELGAFSVRVKFDGTEEAKQAACVERIHHVVLDDAGEKPAFLFLDQTTLVACEVLA